MHLLLQRQRLMHQKMVTGVELTPEQEKELEFVEGKIRRLVAAKDDLEARLKGGSKKINDLKKYRGVLKQLYGKQTPSW